MGMLPARDNNLLILVLSLRAALYEHQWTVNGRCLVKANDCTSWRFSIDQGIFQKSGRVQVLRGSW